MIKPKYFVAFGGFTLHNVETVEDESGREISEYDSVGAGKFNVPDSREPKKWKIECMLQEDTGKIPNTWRASEIFKAMDSLLNNTEDASRLVITNLEYPAANLSVLAWFKRYSKVEKYSGIYSVVIELEEYKPVGIKTTGIPTVKRPGKVPIPPKVTITKKNTVYRTKKKYIGSGRSHTNTKNFSLKNSKTGKPVSNPVTAKPNVKYVPHPHYTPQKISEINFNSSASQALYGPKRSWGDVGNAIKSFAGKAGNAIGNAYNNWKKRRADFKKKIGW